ncbi:MAG: hypothetical protein QXG01_01930, partial [Candidatus Bathyarchaeia archaeon]
ILLDRVKGIAILKSKQVLILIILWSLGVSSIFIGGLLSSSYFSAIAALSLLGLTMLLTSLPLATFLQQAIKNRMERNRIDEVDEKA